MIKQFIRSLLLYMVINFCSMHLLASDGHDVKPWALYPYASLDADTIEMGTLEAGIRTSGEIRLFNKGVKNLVIGRVRSGCGLMVPSWQVEPILQNEEAVIRFRFDTSHPGRFERKVIIHTNAYQKTMVVTVRGKVIPAGTPAGIDEQ